MNHQASSLHRCVFRFLLAILLVSLSLATDGSAREVSYAILSSETTAADEGWQKVIGALEKKYPGATKIRFADGKPGEALDQLKKSRPRYACFVAQHAEVTRAFVTQVHQLTRGLDDDPYADVLWGILYLITGGMFLLGILYDTFTLNDQISRRNYFARRFA